MEYAHTSRRSAYTRAYQGRAAVLTILMHGLLLAVMVLMVDWKSVHVAPDVMQAALWDALPETAPAVPKPEVAEKMPEPEIKPVPVTKPAPAVDQTAEPPAEIALKKMQEEKQQAAEKKQAQLKKIQDALRAQDEAERLKAVQDSVRQQALDSPQSGATEADPSLLANYVQKMRSKIRGNLVQSLCPVSNPELILEMRLTATGDLTGTPRVIKGSGEAVCDEAVLRAILSAKPYELPTEDAATRAKMLDLIRLKLKPRG